MSEIHTKHGLLVYEDGNFRSVDIERVVGSEPYEIAGRTYNNPVYHKREYRPTAASMKRVHRVATKLVNEQKAQIYLTSKMYTLELDY